MKIPFRSVVDMAFVCCVCGCSPAPTEAPKTPPPAAASSAQTSDAKPEAATSPETTAKSENVDLKSDEPTQEGEIGGQRKASRPPLDLITNPTALFVFNFGDSDAGKAAKERCEATGGTRSEIAACLQKARDKVPVESLRFMKKKDGYWWVTLNRYKGSLIKWHIVQFQVGEQKDDRIALKPVGKDKGIAPMGKLPRSVEIELPNDYSIVLNDPEFGKMSFDTKFGKIEE